MPTDDKAFEEWWATHPIVASPAKTSMPLMVEAFKSLARDGWLAGRKALLEEVIAKLKERIGDNESQLACADAQGDCADSVKYHEAAIKELEALCLALKSHFGAAP